MAPMWAMRLVSWEAQHRTHPACWGCMDKACVVTQRPQERLDPLVMGGTVPQHQRWRDEGGASLNLKWGKNPTWHPVSGSLPLPWRAAGRAMDDQESASY